MIHRTLECMLSRLWSASWSNLMCTKAQHCFRGPPRHFFPLLPSLSHHPLLFPLYTDNTHVFHCNTESFITQNILTAVPKYSCMLHFKSVKMKANCRKQKEVVKKSHPKKICMPLHLLIKCGVNMQNRCISTLMYCKLTEELCHCLLLICLCSVISA